MSFLKLLNNIRLEHAVSDLLYTDKTVIKIAMENGFPNQAGFNNAFREIYHCTPAELPDGNARKREESEQPENSEQIMERVEQYLTYNLISSPESGDSTVRELEIDVTKKERTERNWCKLINVGTRRNCCGLMCANISNILWRCFILICTFLESTFR